MSMKSFWKNTFTSILSCCLALTMACKDDPKFPEPAKNNLIKGADVSWLTEMESAGKKFYTKDGVQMEGIQLMKSLGMNAIRLRVWVNPENGWNNIDDVLVKAKRVRDADMKLMINFHYSDGWADPSKQTIPAAWSDFDIEEMKDAVAAHTEAVLTQLKDNDVVVDWVQVGNETGNGMLWDIGKASVSMANYAALTMAGYHAVKNVYPDAKVIVHIESGEVIDKFNWILKGLKDHGAKWDVIGMSLYPIAGWRNTNETWQEINTKTFNNMNTLVATYNSEIMICEVGLPWDHVMAYEALRDIMRKVNNVNGGKGLGVFYWEPQSYGGWNGYTMGAFDNSGRPTRALDAFK
jgi:arabinogalactan endo-1,4-beta-galactosidase